jgi:DNA-binding MarR family transcriptional regulator
MERLDGLQELVLKSFEGTGEEGARGEVRTAPNYSPAVTKAVKQLLKEQYLETDSCIAVGKPSPKRFYDFYKLTEKGKDYLKAIKPVTVDLTSVLGITDKLKELTQEESELQVTLRLRR